MHTYIHTYIHTCMHAYTHTRQICMYILIGESMQVTRVATCQVYHGHGFRHIGSPGEGGSGFICLWCHRAFPSNRDCLVSGCHRPCSTRAGSAFIAAAVQKKRKRVHSFDGTGQFGKLIGVWLRTRRFSEPTFRPSQATNHWKTLGSSFFRLSLLFSSPLLFHFAFPSVHIVGN